MEYKRSTNVDSAKVMQVIEVKSMFGSGTEDDPCRTVVEYFDLDGKLLARVDYFIAD